MLSLHSTIEMQTKKACMYRVSQLVEDLVWLTWNVIVPLSAPLCLGWWEFGRSGLAARKNGGTRSEQMGHPVKPLNVYLPQVYCAIAL